MTPVPPDLPITIMMDGSVSDDLIKEWINDSYELIVLGLPKNKREELKMQ